MKDTIQMILSLGIICIVCAGLLSLVYGLTSPIIDSHKMAEIDRGLLEVLDADSFDAHGDYYIGLNRGIPIGIVIKKNTLGYNGPITVLVGVSKDKTITGVKILDHTETPGLGSRIAEPAFLGQFIGNSLKKKDYDSITGATISSKAVISVVTKELEQYYGEVSWN